MFQRVSFKHKELCVDTLRPCLIWSIFGIDNMCMSFYNMLRYYCTDLTTKGLCLLERAKVFTIPPLLVQTISLGYEVLPPPSIARHAGSRSVSVSTMVVLRCLVSFPCCGSGVVSSSLNMTKLTRQESAGKAFI